MEGKTFHHSSDLVSRWSCIPILSSVCVCVIPCLLYPLLWFSLRCQRDILSVWRESGGPPASYPSNKRWCLHVFNQPGCPGTCAHLRQRNMHMPPHPLTIQVRSHLLVFSVIFPAISFHPVGTSFRLRAYIWKLLFPPYTQQEALFSVFFSSQQQWTYSISVLAFANRVVTSKISAYIHQGKTGLWKAEAILHKASWIWSRIIENIPRYHIPSGCEEILSI